MKHIAATISVLIACAIGLQALEAREGLVKLVVDESTARISVYRLVDVAKDRYEPLIFDSDPRTSFATLSVDGRLYKLGDAAEFRPTTKRTDTGAQIEFRSASFVVRQILDFARSDGSALADGLRVSFEIENISEGEASLGLRYLLDTWLGEKSGIHFETDKRPRISQETAILPIPTTAGWRHREKKPASWFNSPDQASIGPIKSSSRIGSDSPTLLGASTSILSAISRSCHTRSTIRRSRYTGNPLRWREEPRDASRSRWETSTRRDIRRETRRARPKRFFRRPSSGPKRRMRLPRWRPISSR